jgi:hypothetical protein
MYVKWKLVLVRLEIVLISAQVHGLRRMYHRLGNHFGRTRWYSNVKWVKWKLISVRLETVLISHKIGAWFAPNVPQAWKSFWAHPTVLLGDVCHVEAHFKWQIVSICLEIVLILMQDRCTVCAECTIGLKIILGATNGSPM